MEKINYLSLPKIELHLHLDCSMSYEVVKVLDPSIDYEAYQDSFIAAEKCKDLAEYLASARSEVALLQTKEALYLTTLDLFQQLKEDNVIYAELRFAPLNHLEKGLTGVEVVQTVDKAIREGMRQTGIHARMILCTLRHFSPTQSMETVKLVEQFQETTVAGFDIASDEAGFSIDNHIAAFEYANEKGLNITAHAGEAKGAESVQETMQYFKPSRIGHGVRSVEDKDIVALLKNKNIHLEVCPTSNVQTNVTESIATHPLQQLYEQGISMSINTDTRTISNVSLTEEYHKLRDVFGWKKEDFKNCNLEAIKHSFVEKEVKEELRRAILLGYNI